MAGSGTTLVTARLRGHKAIGFDRDPLAVLISDTWVSNVDANAAEKKAKEILRRARGLALTYKSNKGKAFPTSADKETRDFIRYWFDNTNRVQLTALSKTIARLRDHSIQSLMWCAFSRLIITKKVGVSLAMDVSHSRPHRKYKMAPIKAFDHFIRSVKQVTKASPFSSKFQEKPQASVKNADARHLPLKANSVDIVITSPPYLNAIDYIRGHKLSLVWMGYTITKLRNLRSTNIGTETVTKSQDDKAATATMKSMCMGAELSTRNTGILKQYVQDTKSILLEIERVLRPNGKAIIVVGNCNIRDTFIKNSRGIAITAKQVGLTVEKTRKRLLPTNRRYLPPPSASGAGKALQKRMREEVILTLLKPHK
jgi:SAM-dependent methyltransferase